MPRKESLASIALYQITGIVDVTRALHKLAPSVRPLSSHCAEQPAKGLPDSSDPIRQDGLQGQVLAITHEHEAAQKSPDCCRINLRVPMTQARPKCILPVPKTLPSLPR
jgi:hypothetical protein